eukprot:TRINITY_DN62222_c0_g1_i1.p1 TRINITY_DN62222_c0_g1~~TRINITY_DN62222_c0_g1_i1.p1  ORF type:complete len:270 (-),score=28.91 TRINITY_DN62222_c0_g1_i1:37-846(-)
MSASAGGTPAAVVRRWRSGVLDPPPGCLVDVPIPDVDAGELECLVTYCVLLRYRAEDSFHGADDGVAADVPEWACRFLSGFHWTPLRVQAFLTAALGSSGEEVACTAATQGLLHLNDCPGQDGEAPESGLADSSGRSSASEASRQVSKQRRDTKWGRCAFTWCRQLALQPVLGSRGPFLACSSKTCRFKKDLTPEQWRKLPKTWLKFWPVSWAGVKPFQRPCRPVDSLGASAQRQRRRSVRHRLPTSQVSQVCPDFLGATLSQASSGGA